MSLVRCQLNLFFIALGFFTRIPVPKNLDYSQQKLNRASRYFSLVGWLVGAICAGVYLISATVFPVHIAVILSMIFSVLLTGCFHEDGLADTCDGFGGGWTAQQKLSIMKDSRIGTYGTVALWSILTLKFSLLVSIEQVAMALLVAHPVSRAFSSGFIFTLPYVVDSEQAKVKPLAESAFPLDLALNLLFAILALTLVIGASLKIGACLIVLFIALHFFYRRQIGGFSGDTLGAAQQFSEVAIYAVLLAGQTG